MPRHRNGAGSERAESGGALMPHGSAPGVMTQIRDEFDRMFDRFTRHWPGMGLVRTGEPPWQWDLEVREEDNTVAVRADLPGFAASDIDLQVADDRLTIRATHKSEVDEKDKGWTRQRREYYQTVPLPSAVDVEKIDAHFRNGVLTVRLPKTEQAAGRRIAIRES
jgi:HSP20 family protein